MISGDVIYTAQWSPITYTIAFSGGEGGQGAMDSIPATYDQEVTLPKNTFTRPGYYFNGWSTSSGASSGSYADEKPVKNLTTKQGGDGHALRRLVRPAGECDPAPEL